jgi:hypothetical protein
LLGKMLPEQHVTLEAKVPNNTLIRARSVVQVNPGPPIFSIS